MMDTTRRSLIRAIPFFGVAAVIPAVASQRTGAVIPLEVAELIADWNRKQDAATSAWRQFEIDVKGLRHSERAQHPNQQRCNVLSIEAESAMGKMVRALRETDLPVDRGTFA